MEKYRSTKVAPEPNDITIEATNLEDTCNELIKVRDPHNIYEDDAVSTRSIQKKRVFSPLKANTGYQRSLSFNIQLVDQEQLRYNVSKMIKARGRHQFYR